MRRSRLLAWSAGLVVSAIAIAACSSSSGGSGDGGSKGAVTLRMASATGDPKVLAALNQLAADFVKVTPGVAKVQIDSAPTQSYATAIRTQIGGGDPPDVGWVGEGDSADFIAQGGLADLAPTLKGDSSYDFADLNLAAMSGWTRGDAIYGVPFSTSPAVVYYNADMFTKAGLPTPTQMQASGTWTWDGLAAAAKKIHDSQHVAGFYVDPYMQSDSNWTALAHLWYAFGAEPWSADGKTCEFTSPQMVQAMTFLHSMMFTDGTYPKPGVSADFGSGQAAMITSFASKSSALSSVKFKWGVVGLPSGPAGARPVIGQSAFVAFAASKHKKEAAQFVAYLTNAQSEKTLAKWFPPIRKSVLTADALAGLLPALTKDQLQSVIVQGIQNGKLDPVHTDMAEIQPAGKAALEALWKPDANVSDVMNSMCKALSPLLTKTTG